VGTAFVAGATGYTGHEVVRLLSARGVETHAHVRPDSPRLEGWRGRFGALGARTDATPWDEGALTATLRRVAPDAVFALLGTTRARGRAAAARGARETYESVDYGLTALLLRASVASGARPRFVYLSAVGVTDGARNRYVAARARVERELRASGLPFTIVRPSFITGPDREEDRPLERAAARAADAALGLAAALGARAVADRYRSMTARALAERLVALAFDPAAEGATVEGSALRRGAVTARPPASRSEGPHPRRPT
jgi:nucleoside-diphosphate-sugar epimerase